MEKWSSKRAFILATIGSAVGIANIWRFSAIAGDYGGGAFMLPFALAVVFLAMPLMMLEMSVGRHLESDVVSAFRDLGERFLPIGFAIGVVLVVLTGVYLTITGWTLAFLTFSVTPMEMDFSTFSSSYMPVAFFLVSLIITVFIVSKGIRQGIEKVVTKLVPLQFLILGILVAYSVTTDGFTDSLRYLFTPNIEMLTRMDVWVAAFGQAFFSLAVGYGLILTYASYMGHDINIPQSVGIITLADVGAAILSGTVIFSVVFAQGLDPAMGPELAFSTLPLAFEAIPIGWLLAILFFGLLFAAAITSAVSMMEVPVAAILNNSRLSRPHASYGVGLALLVIGMLTTLSYSALDLRIGGERVLDVVDYTFGTLGIPVAAFFTALVFAWYVEDIQLVLEIDPFWGRIILPLVRYLVPPVLLIVIVFQFI